MPVLLRVVMDRGNPNLLPGVLPVALRMCPHACLGRIPGTCLLPTLCEAIRPVVSRGCGWLHPQGVMLRHMPTNRLMITC